MKGVADYHIHTKFCHHATGEMEEYVRVAVEKGFTEIGFADHAPASDGYDPVHRMALSRFPEYVERIQGLRDEFTHMNIRLGIETDFYPGFEPFLERFLQSFPVDYVVGSDAHKPEEVGANFNDAVVLLEKVGYRNKGFWEDNLSVFLPERQ